LNRLIRERAAVLLPMMLVVLISSLSSNRTLTQGSPLPEQDSRDAQTAAPTQDEDAHRAAERAPIDWHPFAEEPFLRAQALDRPILLVVTAAWNRQSALFIDKILGRPDVSAVIRRSFIPVYVDADLRPDVTRRFPASVWPAVSVLTPLGEPVYYRPEEEGSEPVRVTLGTVDPERLGAFLEEASRYYHLMSKGGAGLAGLYRRALIDEMKKDKKVLPIEDTDIDSVAELLRSNHDVVHGGFGRTPKFLMPSALEASFMIARLRDDTFLLDAAERTLSSAAAALIDPVEGGVHRLAVREDWSGVQYEKLLDRNAQALEVFCDAFRATGKGLYLQQARLIAGYMMTTLSLANGGFALGQTADMTSIDGGDYYRAAPEARQKMKRPEVIATTLAGSTARAARALMIFASIGDSPRARDRALGALEFLDSKLYRRQRGVLHAWDGRRSLGPILLDDQIPFISAHMEAYEQTGEQRHMDLALDVAWFVRNNLKDPEMGLLRDRIPLAGGPTPMQIPLHPYEENCEAARVFARLHYYRRGITKEAWNVAARELLTALAAQFSTKGPRAADYGLAAAEYFSPPIWIILVGNPNANQEARKLFDSAYKLDLFFRLREILDPKTKLQQIRQARLIRRNPPAVYLSREGVTTKPASTVEELLENYAALLAAEKAQQEAQEESAGPDEDEPDGPGGES
jgi:uncharacterized protein YyaL (SSP411 family)